MFKEGDRVTVILQTPHVEGVVEKVSTWRDVLGGATAPDDRPCYFVIVQKWDNGGLWFGESALAAPEAEL